MQGVAVTGMGIISSLGTTTEENLDALKAKKDGISIPEILSAAPLPASLHRQAGRQP